MAPVTRRYTASLKGYREYGTPAEPRDLTFEFSVMTSAKSRPTHAQLEAHARFAARVDDIIVLDIASITEIEE